MKEMYCLYRQKSQRFYPSWVVQEENLATKLYVAYRKLIKVYYKNYIASIEKSIEYFI